MPLFLISALVSAGVVLWNNGRRQPVVEATQPKETANVSEAPVEKDNTETSVVTEEEVIVMSEENTPPLNDVPPAGKPAPKTASVSFVHKPGCDVRRKPFDYLASLVAADLAKKESERVVELEIPIEKSAGRVTETIREGGSPEMRGSCSSGPTKKEGHPQKEMIIPNEINSTFFGVEFR